MTRQSIQARFEQFHEANPDVYKEIIRIAFELRANGVKRYSMDGIIHTVRYFSIVGWRGKGAPEQYKISNDYTSRYARMIVDDYPELASMFTLKGLKTA